MNNSDPLMNQSRGDGDWRDDVKPALDNLMERIFAHENVTRAWARVKTNRGVAGVDGMTIEEYPAYAAAHWEEIRQTLMDGTYQPQPVRRVSIPKPSGGERLLGIPCVLDRVIQQAILQVLSPMFESGFSNSSYGSRPRRSAHGAIRQLKSDIKAGYRIAVDIDLEKFFDTVDHDKLMTRVRHKVTDKVLCGVIGRYLRAGVMVGSAVQATDWGTPQGSPISAMLANILLDDLDKELEARGHRFCRYMDDLVILVKSRRAGRRVMTSVGHYLSARLKLKVNRDKSRVVKVDQLEFLGFTFRSSSTAYGV
jgi:RNA-directed DNA polymerase